MRKKLLIIGLGVLGSKLLDLLMQSHHNLEIVVAGRDVNKIQERANLSLLTAANLGYENKMEVAYLDLNNMDQTFETIQRINPEIIFNAATRMSYWVPSTLPSEIFAKLYHAFTGWMAPLHLTLAYKLMSVVKQIGGNIKVINSAYPDVVNPALSKLGLGPDVGIGNLANITPVITEAIHRYLNVPKSELKIHAYGHHHFSYVLPSRGSDEGVPYYLEVFKGEEQITNQINFKNVFQQLSSELRRTRGTVGMSMTAASAKNVITAMAENTDRIIHAPGPNGLPGGYPIKIVDGKVQVIPSQKKSLDILIDINVQGQILDGVAKIDDEGYISFSEREMSIVSDIFGYHCSRMHVTESEYVADELVQKFHEVQNKVYC